MQHDFRFCLKGPCSSVHGQKMFCRHSQIWIIIQKCYQRKIFWQIYKKKCTPKSVLRWEFALVYIWTWRGNFMIQLQLRIQWQSVFMQWVRLANPWRMSAYSEFHIPLQVLVISSKTSWEFSKSYTIECMSKLFMFFLMIVFWYIQWVSIMWMFDEICVSCHLLLYYRVGFSVEVKSGFCSLLNCSRCSNVVENMSGYIEYCEWVLDMN